MADEGSGEWLWARAFKIVLLMAFVAVVGGLLLLLWAEASQPIAVESNSHVQTWEETTVNKTIDCWETHNESVCEEYTTRVTSGYEWHE